MGDLPVDHCRNQIRKPCPCTWSSYVPLCSHHPLTPPPLPQTTIHLLSIITNFVVPVLEFQINEINHAACTFWCLAFFHTGCLRFIHIMSTPNWQTDANFFFFAGERRRYEWVCQVGRCKVRALQNKSGQCSHMVLLIFFSWVFSYTQADCRVIALRMHVNNESSLFQYI